LGDSCLKMCSNRWSKMLSGFPKSSFGEHKVSSCIRGWSFLGIYASQTKILKTETAGRACPFEVLCEGVSTRFGRRMLAKYLERTRPTCCFGFQNLRLGGIELSEMSACQLSSDQKIARFQDHLSEHRLGTHTWQTIYKIFYTFGH